MSQTHHDAGCLYARRLCCWRTSLKRRVQWYQSREVRLGDVRAGRERTFEVPMRGREVRVTFGNTSSRNGQGFSDFVQVNAGESWEWTITTGSVFFRRLSQ